MNPAVSVVVPTHDHGRYVGDAIRSVLGQSMQDLELVVVDDGSTDDTQEVVARFSDRRLRYLWQKNRGLPAARNAGVRASSAALVAFLDADDVFEEGKLARQLDHLKRDESIGVSYGAHVLVTPQLRPLSLPRPPMAVGVREILADYPFAPSDIVVRRSWGNAVGWFDESFLHYSEDLDFHLRLALAGCRIAGVVGARTLRRVYPRRVFPHVAERIAGCVQAIDEALSDPRCPQDVRLLRDKAVARRYATWGYFATAQGEDALARDSFREALRLWPRWGGPDRCELLELVVSLSIMDGEDHEPRLRAALACIAPAVEGEVERAVGRGCLLRGVRTLLWEEAASAELDIERGAALCGGLDARFLLQVVHLLLDFQSEFGAHRGAGARRRVVDRLARVARSSDIRLLRGRLSANLAFQSYREGRYPDVARAVAAAVMQQPAYLTDRGLMSVLVRSIGKRARATSGER